MTENEVVIQQYPASQICEVVVRVGGREIVYRCPDYSLALKWARMECKSYKISQLRIEPPIAKFGAEPARYKQRHPGLSEATEAWLRDQ